MKKFRIFLLIIIQIFLSNSKLISVIEVNRHGARSAETFPKYLNQQFWGINEKLTHNGYRQHQLLGKYIRKKYIDTKFISDKYNERDFKIYSTPFQRTIFSANGFLSGLYPNYISKVNFHENQLKYINNDIIPNIDFNVNFEEIPIEVLSYQENVLFNSWKCKLNGELIKEESKDLNLYPDVIPISDDDIIETANYLRKYLLLEDKIAELKKVKKSRKFIKKVNKYITGYFYLYGLNMEKVFPEKIVKVIKSSLVNKWYNGRIKDTKMLKLSSSAFINKIIEIFANAIKGNKKFSKLNVFSAHDAIMANFFGNIFDEKFLRNMISKSLDNEDYYKMFVPPFASNLIFELYKDDKLNNSYYVKILFNGKVISNFPLRGNKYSGKNNMYEFNEFVKNLRARQDNDWNLIDCKDAPLEDEDDNFPDGFDD